MYKADGCVTEPKIAVSREDSLKPRAHLTAGKTLLIQKNII